MFHPAAVWIVVVGTVFGSASLAAEPPTPDDTAAADREKLQGSWLLVYHLFNGKEVDDSKKDTILSFEGFAFTIRVGEDTIEKGVFKEVGANKSPKTFVYVPTEVKGEAVERSYPAIYLLQDDVFIACVGYVGKRPAAFSAEDNSSNELVIYKRVKQ
jgi:uncharacterized protein (TIGR03067 family)